jgi:hypothetical protein
MLDMLIDFAQILIIILIFLIFGTIIALVNLRAKNKQPVNKEQITWQNIERLNVKKKELFEEKKELSYKYTAKSIDDAVYSKTLKFLNEEITKIEEAINEEVSKLTTLQKKDTSEDELRFKNLKIKGDLNEILVENNNLKERVSELEEFIKNMSKQNKQQVCQEDINKIKYYSIIVDKYKDIINENEKKTISELKEMVKPNDLTIKNIVSKFTPIGYDFNKDYLTTLRKVYNYLRTEINVVKNDLKVIFWMDYSKIIKERVCDEQTVAIFLCSCMQSLKDNLSSIEVVLLEGDKVHSFVTTKIKETYYILDVVQEIPFDTYKNQDANKLFEEYRFDNKKIIKKIYSYNNLEYTDYNHD